MKYIHTFSDEKAVSQIALGCMRINRMEPAQAQAYLCQTVELGYRYFDHADIYGGSSCEEVFGKALAANPQLRDQIVIQSKIGIRKGMYDFSKEYLLEAAENSLRRLQVDHLDVLLLHRPDLLMEPEEVAEVFDKLYTSGKVGAFGVSNHSPAQIELLQRCVDQKLCINQMQLGVAHASMIASGANVNLTNDDGTNRDGYLRDYCRLHGITIQPWSPLQHGFISGPFLTNPAFSELNQTLGTLGQKYGLTDTAMAIAWLLRLPDQLQPVIGSTNLQRLKEIAKAADVTLSRKDWYEIYLAAGYQLP